ncbi:SET domain-containing protein [Favolaschia claudopus]|uniref:SET domain-containing protein n=1 Tax=Favolaschia claudopus TaxID=2862362 RepID=A0AAW0A669_9AGAR
MVQLCENSDCSNPGKSRCWRCKERYYCGTECQHADWSAHKDNCKPSNRLVAVVDIPGKGKGVIARERIPRGTLLVAEKPRIILPATSKEKLLKSMSLLSEEDKAFILTFPGKDSDLEDRLKHFVPCVGDGNTCLCPTICRINHTCCSPMSGPNTSYTWNEDSKEEELYAIKEIQKGEEVQVTYMSNASNYDGDPPAYLRRKYNFDCRCPGCTRSPEDRQVSGERIEAYNDFVDILPGRFKTDDPFRILVEIEQQILIICEEGFTGEIDGRAYDAFQLCTAYEDAASAKEWMKLHLKCRALYHGKSTEQYKKSVCYTKNPQMHGGWGYLDAGSLKLRGPSKKVLECFYSS